MGFTKKKMKIQHTANIFVNFNDKRNRKIKNFVFIEEKKKWKIKSHSKHASADHSS